MSKSNILKKIDDIFGDGGLPDSEKLTHLVQESLHFFEELRSKLQSPKEEEKKEAIEQAQELQQKLQDLADQSLAASGMTREQLEELLTKPSNFNPEDWDTYKTVEKEISDYQKEVLKTPSSSKKPPKKNPPKTDKKGWMKS